MRSALGLARRGLGRVAPNPAVGCVLVRPDLGDQVVGRGWTQPGGRPHAETQALMRAGALAVGATAYVTLEPCSHTGKTAPCADALIAAKVSRVVAAMEDPDPRVSGSGIAKLKDAGIDVSVGLMESDASQVNIGFIYKIQRGIPLVSLKTATSMDGKIATVGGHSQWITGPEARRAGHLLRATNDAILVGIGTALADEPSLTCRLDGLSDASPIRVVVDSRLRIPISHKLVTTARDTPTWVCTTDKAEPDKIKALESSGVKILQLDCDEQHRVPLSELITRLAREGLTRVLVEGGSELTTSLLAENLADLIYWFRSTKIIGGDGLDALQSLNISQIADTSAFTRRQTYDMGPDILEVLAQNPSAV